MILPAYLAAYLLFMWVLGFMDAFQHSYEVRYALDGEKIPVEFDREYEEGHTFSNLISGRFHWINLLVLNFCYHNVHHNRSGEPWYRLPHLHEERYAGTGVQEIALPDQLARYQRYRVGRVMQDLELESGPGIGAAGVSFLVGV